MHPTSQQEAIFLTALELSSPAERAAYVEEACRSSPELRDRVQALLKGHDVSHGPFDAPPPGLAPARTEQVVPGEVIGSMIGPYKLREQIGEGGMGIVYVAEQERPVRRKVALKVIKPGMDSREVIARFEAERQALALMDHPNIAKVLDAGTVGQAFQPDAHDTGDVDRQSRQAGKPDLRTGRPYFVMELVRGIPITDYCDKAGVGLRDRLGLFIKVCQAVQHAHQKGIIHRDLKPSNVLVTQHDGVAVPKVIDFGVAKAINQRLSEDTIYTRHAQLIGTPLYMSPEQAELSDLDVDTRSDVYSLGVLLYVLLTGTTPFDMRKAGFDEMRRIIREEEPRRPSQRISTLAARDLTTISRDRGVAPRHLGESLKGDLDWIVMRAMEKDRTRRYESASALAADVQRYLADEPVEACPPSVAYRLRKFARRRRGLLTTAVLLAVAIMTGTGVSVWEAIDANSARNLATRMLSNEREARNEADGERRAALIQRREADLQREHADQQRRLARANFDRAREAVDRMLTRVADQKLAGVPGVEPIRRQLLEDALRFNEQLLEERGDDPELRFAVAMTWRRVGDIRASLGDLTFVTALEQAADIFGSLLLEDPDNAKYIEEFVVACMSIGDAHFKIAGSERRSEDALRRGLAACRRLEVLCRDEPRHRKRSAGILEKLSGLSRKRGQTSEAIELLREAIATQRDFVAERPNQADGRQPLMSSLSGLALLLAPTDFDEADRLLIEAQDLGEELLRFDTRHVVPTDTREFALARVFLRRQEILAGKGRIAEEESLLRRATALLDVQLTASPEVPSPRIEWARANSRLAAILASAGRPAEAEAVYRRMCEFLLDHYGPFSSLPEDLARAIQGWVSLLAARGRSDDEEVAGIRRRFVAILEGQLDDQSKSGPELARIYVSTGKCYRILGDVERMRTAFRRAMEIDPSQLDFATLDALAEFLFAAQEYRDALPYIERLIVSNPGSSTIRKRAGRVYFAVGRFGDALLNLAAAVEADPGDLSTITAIPNAAVAGCRDEAFQEGMIALADKIAANAKDIAQARSVRASLLMAMLRFSEAERDLSQAIESAPNNPDFVFSRALCRVLMREYRSAVTDYTRVIESNPKHYTACNNLAWLLATCPDREVRDPRRAVELAEQAAAGWPNAGHVRNTLGACRYRAGDWPGALESLQKSMDLTAGGNSFDWFFVAMTHRQLGNHDQARTWYDKAVEWMDGNQRDDEELGRFRAEAAELLGLDEARRGKEAPPVDQD